MVLQSLYRYGIWYLKWPQHDTGNYSGLNIKISHYVHYAGGFIEKAIFWSWVRVDRLKLFFRVMNFFFSMSSRTKIKIFLGLLPIPRQGCVSMLCPAWSSVDDTV